MDEWYGWVGGICEVEPALSQGTVPLSATKEGHWDKKGDRRQDISRSAPHNPHNLWNIFLYPAPCRHCMIFCCLFPSAVHTNKSQWKAAGWRKQKPKKKRADKERKGYRLADFIHFAQIREGRAERKGGREKFPKVICTMYVFFDHPPHWILLALPLSSCNFNAELYLNWTVHEGQCSSTKQTRLRRSHESTLAAS